MTRMDEDALVHVVSEEIQDIACGESLFNGLFEVCIEASPACPTVLALFLAVICYSLLSAKRHRRKRHELAKELEAARARVQFLNAQLVPTEDKKEVRIFMDGAFDLLHYGHMNAFRLARSLGTYLVAGVNSDRSITECKGGAPLLNDQERLNMVQSCKFVDEVVTECPYIMNREYLDYVIEKYNIDYVIHGDDPCIVDGKDVYAPAKEAGKFRTIPRTEGVSTTDILGRMLLMSKEHHYHNGSSEDSDRNTSSEAPVELLGRQSKFLTTSRMLQLFSNGIRAPSPSMRVVYIDGAWDLFHPGHVAVLKAARERGDYLIVGIHGDAVVNRRRGMNLPLMNLHERVLSVLGCRYVDDVLIDAPAEITPEMVASLKIAEVVRGTHHDDIGLYHEEARRYSYPKEAGIFTVIDSPSNFNLASIVQRVQRNQETFQAKFERKRQAEQTFYQSKYSHK